MNRDDVDRDRLVVVGGLAAAADFLRANRTLRFVAIAVFLGVGAVKLVGAFGGGDVVTALGLDGMFALLIVADLVGIEYRRRHPLPE